jgi:predicted nucleic acid-binding protein
MIVVDASAMVAFLADAGGIGQATRSIIGHHAVAFPSVMSFEVANTMRRLVTSRATDARFAHQCLARLAAIQATEVGFAPLVDRIWELRGQVTAYDAAYVALAELFDVPLLTLDDRLRRAQGTRCTFVDL